MENFNFASATILDVAQKPNQGRSERTMLKEFLVKQLTDLYWAEKHLLEALPKMKNAATSNLMMQVFTHHLKTTEKQVIKLEKVFCLLAAKTDTDNYSLEAQSEEVAEPLVAKGSVKKKPEHYEIASYGGLAQLARALNETAAADLLEEILMEEKEADNALNKLSTSVND